MKVFWSWQSDTDGNIGRHFLRDAIEECIQELSIGSELEEAERGTDFEGLHLDHDRKGVPGSPDLARLIFEKIEASTVFIADVTSVGCVDIDVVTSNKGKRLINSNVAIELGYALAKVGDRSIIMVMNSHYGEHANLPFDLRAKAGPILFKLAPLADKTEIASQKRLLKGTLRSALRECLMAAIKDKQLSEIHNQRKPDVTSEDWEALGEKLKSMCQGLRADSQYRGDTQKTTWRIAGGRNATCASYLSRAGAMLRRSAKVRETINDVVLSEPDDMDRWLSFLQYRGCLQSKAHAFEEHDDGTRIMILLGSIEDLPEASFRACLDLANAEF
ncbi:hypothetical protein [Terriglobus sp. ADX1]|uniref:hypothetical protein n=1 Tax=Terriglobus sp. ADX1 TaxID=2794063 RepID=UPI002FE6BF13